jgi:hypothetical protein
VRIGSVRSGIIFALVAMAVAACSKGMLKSDSATTGAGGHAGAGGGAAAAGGTGGFPCTAADVYVTCDVVVAEPPVAGTAGASCSDEGARCEGYGCSDSSGGYAWEAICCFGVWLNYSGPCPALADRVRLP